MEGYLEGGERLREQELCERLNVSRPTLREALRTLEGERLIDIAPHRGPTVVLITEKIAADLYALRELLEGYAAYKFTQTASDELIDELRRAAKALRSATKKKDHSMLLSAKRDLYDILLKGCGNDLVKELLPSMLSRINLLRATSFSQPKRLSASIAEIDQLLDRIAARDANGARLAAQQHVHNAKTAALEVLRRSAPQQDAAD
jgi:DNA-binding GntR family transcriptional regulator